MQTIRLFCDVANSRSISKAAELHQITQSAVSQRIQALEKSLGVTLIDRSKRPLDLTAAGRAFYDGCRQILQQYEDLTRDITGDEEPLRGEVTVAAIYSAGIGLLNQITKAFGKQHPQATVSITYHQPEAVCERVRREQCDVGVVSYPQRWRDLASVPMRDETMAVVVRAGHALSGMATVWASQLVEHPMVSFDEALPISRAIRRYLRDQGVRPTIVNQFDNIDTIKTYIAETDTVGILPERTVRREVEAGALVAVPLEPTLVRPMGVVYLRHRTPTPLVRAFIEYLSKHDPSRGQANVPATVNV